MFCIKFWGSKQLLTNCFSEREPVRAMIFWVETEPIFFTRSRSWEKIARLHSTGI